MNLIIVPTDFSKSAAVAYPIAHDIAKQLGKHQAQVILLHISESIVDATFGFTFGEKKKDVDRELEEKAIKKLEAIATKYFLDIVPQTAVIRADHCADKEIARFAATHEASLIVMATHGNSGIEHALLGRIAEKVVRRSHCPVWVVPAKGFAA